MAPSGAPHGGTPLALLCWAILLLSASAKLDERGIVYESEYLKADLTFPQECGREDGEAGTFRVLFDNGRGQVVNLASKRAYAVKNCNHGDELSENETAPIYHEYGIVAELHDVILPIAGASGTAHDLELREAKLSLQGDGDFGETDWYGVITGSASIYAMDTGAGRDKGNFNATVAFKITRRAAPVLQHVSGDASLSLKRGVGLVGSLHFSNCSGGGVSLHGSVALTIDEAMLSVAGAKAEVNLACTGDVIVKTDTISVKLGTLGVRVDDVSVHLSLAGPHFKEISGNVTGKGIRDLLWPGQNICLLLKRVSSVVSFLSSPATKQLTASLPQRIFVGNNYINTLQPISAKNNQPSSQAR